MRMLDLILKKREGKELAFDELDFIAQGAAKGSLPDYQLSSWLMAVFFKGLTYRETADFTRAMAFSGERLDLKSIKGPKIDKHSTGGVGDGISLALAPIVGACGVPVPMMSGRGLGHTGGTLDKLEAVKGFNVRLSTDRVIKQLNAINVCMFGQTGELAPSDKKLYSLRDVTGTVESIPLIVASILSKKYAEGINGLVMDVKFGSGAFMQDFKKSRELALCLKKTAELLGIKAVAVLSDMNNPLGRAIGNGIEMEQAIRILRGEKIAGDYEELLHALAGHMIYMGKKAGSVEEGVKKSLEAVKNGGALKTMRQMIKWQGGDERVVDSPKTFLPRARFACQVRAPKGGYIESMESRTLGWVGVALGVGRTKAEDSVDFGAGMWLEKKAGEAVKKNEVIAEIFSSDASKLDEAKKMFLGCMKISSSKPKLGKIIREIIS
ncbi:MAG: thymidine phosphorylase [Elusimicrobia bacterium CG08_land_8_20_14_0_20_51_18]|nr:MAG: thymidine phosphorylase [Elusimicrobia bacterium CG08_land_8_20_14_0_20_51_18]